ncbi:ICMT-domain-containing protein [Suillus weaverae]|nr:ICMT-domain-containing protein [Suillus weaverae]
MSDLLKIPFLVASAIGVHFSFTSSSQLPSPEEKVMPTVFESAICSAMAFCGLDLTKVAWAMSSAEVANILAMHIDLSQVPEGTYGARAVQLLCSLHPTPITPTFIASSLAIVIGGALRFYCISTLGTLWSFQLSIRKEHKLVTSGPYSIVRHPSYTGLLLQNIGIIVMYGSQGSWMRQSGILDVPFVKVLAAVNVLFLAIGFWISITRPAVEDKMLRRTMGEDWENWAKKVKYRLLPGVY